MFTISKKDLFFLTMSKKKYFIFLLCEVKYISKYTGIYKLKFFYTTNYLIYKIQLNCPPFLINQIAL